MILPDHAIRRLCVPGVEDLEGEFLPMIEPFSEAVDAPGVISFGLTSGGYDLRLGSEILVFKNTYGAEVVNPKRMKDESYRGRILDNFQVSGDYARQMENIGHPGNAVVIPPNSYILGRSLEYLRIPRHLIARCLGKSSYARCFDKETRVALVDGSRPTFEELAQRSADGEMFYGYGHDGINYVAQLLDSPRRVGREKVVDVVLDNESVVRCTPDHKFHMRNGGVREARLLEEGDSLLPLYLNDSHGYESVYNPARRTWRCTHLMVEDMLVTSGRWQQKGAKQQIHHLDGNRRNNHPDNLVRLSPADHTRLHNAGKDLSAQAKIYWSDGEKKRKHLDVLHGDESRRKSVEARKRFYATAQGKEMFRKRNARMWAAATQERREQQAAIARKMNIREDVTEDKVIAALREAGTLRGASKLLNVDRTAFRRFPEVVRAFKAGELTNNHKVVTVKKVWGSRPVYCLTAPLTGNFALDAGVIVSNCGIIVNVTPLEPEWCGHLTIEISNSSPCPAYVFVGEGIAQVQFEVLQSAPEVSYKDKGGKYQGQTGVTPAIVR